MATIRAITTSVDSLSCEHGIDARGWVEHVLEAAIVVGQNESTEIIKSEAQI